MPERYSGGGGRYRKDENCVGRYFLGPGPLPTIVRGLNPPSSSLLYPVLLSVRPEWIEITVGPGIPSGCGAMSCDGGGGAGRSLLVVVVLLG